MTTKRKPKMRLRRNGQVVWGDTLDKWREEGLAWHEHRTRPLTGYFLAAHKREQRRAWRKRTHIESVPMPAVNAAIEREREELDK